MKDRIKIRINTKELKNLLIYIIMIIKKCLYNEEILYKEFYNIQLNKQNIYLDRINNIALNPFESKRYWIDNINNLPYGYKE